MNKSVRTVKYGYYTGPAIAPIPWGEYTLKHIGNDQWTVHVGSVFHAQAPLPVIMSLLQESAERQEARTTAEPT